MRTGPVDTTRTGCQMPPRFWWPTMSGSSKMPFRFRVGSSTFGRCDMTSTASTCSPLLFAWIWSVISNWSGVNHPSVGPRYAPSSQTSALCQMPSNTSQCRLSIAPESLGNENVVRYSTDRREASLGCSAQWPGTLISSQAVSSKSCSIKLRRSSSSVACARHGPGSTVDTTAVRLFGFVPKCSCLSC